MNKKTFTMLFTLIATVINIVLTLVLITAMIVLSSLILIKGIHIQNQQILMPVFTVCFLGGVVLDMMLYSRICTWVIRKFDLVSKLDERLMGRYYETFKKESASGSRQTKPEPEKPKTVLPKSVLPDDEWENKD